MRDRIGRITLWGVDGEPFPLSRPGEPCEDGISLTAVPEGLSGVGVEHIFDEATGEHRGMVDVAVRPYRLDLQAEGRNPRQHVHELLQALGSGEHPVALSVVSPHMGWRWKEMYFREVSEIDWHGHAAGSPIVKFSVLLEVGRRSWRRFDEEITLDRSTQWGSVTIPIDGDLDVWPRFTISGAHQGVRIKLHPMDEEQVVPAGGWVIDSHPERRLVADLNGVQLFNGFVPFWPEPVRNVKGEGTMQITVVSPGPDFKMTINYTPEASRAW